MEETLNSIYEKFLDCTGVSIDTRSIADGNLFFGLKGPNFNGNLYAKDALQKGASFAIVDDPALAVISDPRYILVPDSLEILQQLARHHRGKFKGHVFALTGSNGKTTTKELMIRALAPTFKVHGTEGNLNNHLGVPLTLLRLPMDTDIAVIEMGANKVGDIVELCNIALPTHGLITNIGIAHAEGFGGREGIIRGKSELFDFLLKTQGTVFINDEDHVISNMGKRFTDPKRYPNKQCVLSEAAPVVKYEDANHKIHTTTLTGEYNFLNIAAAIHVADFFGVDVDKIHHAITSYVPDNNRSQILTLGSNKIILDAYNANPDSMRAAIRSLLQFDAARKIALLGSMKELGDLGKAMHTEIFHLGSDNGIQDACFVGEEFLSLKEADDSFFNNVDGLIEFLKAHPIANSTVLIKGSRSIEMEKLINVKEIWN